MQNLTRESVLETIRADGAEDWKAVVHALEDGAYLRSIGIEDTDVPAVEDAHDHAQRSASIHPHHKF